jgi:hypothetical protein
MYKVKGRENSNVFLYVVKSVGQTLGLYVKSRILLKSF